MIRTCAISCPGPAIYAPGGLRRDRSRDHTFRLSASQLQIECTVKESPERRLLLLFAGCRCNLRSPLHPNRKGDENAQTVNPPSAI